MSSHTGVQLPALQMVQTYLSTRTSDRKTEGIKARIVSQCSTVTALRYEGAVIAMLPPTAEQTHCVHREYLGGADADLLYFVKYTSHTFFSIQVS